MSLTKQASTDEDDRPRTVYPSTPSYGQRMHKQLDLSLIQNSVSHNSVGFIPNDDRFYLARSWR